MDENKDKAMKKDTSSEAALERGRTAVATDKEINKKDIDSRQIKKESAEDAEKWRNEG